MKILLVFLIIVLLWGYIPSRKRFGDVSLIVPMLVVFLLGLLLGWY